MSADHVFSIIEILQHILCELPPLDITQCRRINSTWKQLIDDSPLLQYRAWLRNDCPDPAYRVTADDYEPHVWGYGGSQTSTREHDNKRYFSNVSRHLHPIVVANIMRNPPRDARFQFDPVSKLDENGFGGYLCLRPVLLRDLRQWYERNKATSHIWGEMSLCRPDARKVIWEIPDSEGAGIRFNLEATPVKAEDYNPDIDGYEFRVNKAPGQPLILTVGDLMKKLDWAWDRWIDSEHEEHYLSHDGGGCDYDMGIPGEGCLEDKEEDSNEEEEDEETFGTKMTMEEHIEQAMMKASD